MDLEEALPAVRGERGTLANVLMNLCVNAIDAMPEGGDLTLRTRSLPGSQVELQVVDNGRGMPPSVLARAMEPFFTTKPLGKGTGLGLALAYATAKAHGGNLSLQSEAGQGSTVTLRLPSVAGATQAEAEPEPAQVSAAATRILLVDDDELILVAIPAMIETLGHHVTVAAGGPEALALLEAPEPFDLVILDLNMPGMNGVETFERIRHGWPNLPVLIATGYLDSATTYLLQKAGLALSISKPYSLRELDQRIQELRNLPVR
jgi:CheY-like chemotaxis protein